MKARWKSGGSRRTIALLPTGKLQKWTGVDLSRVGTVSKVGLFGSKFWGKSEATQELRFGMRCGS
jgi:hypothetical protein